MSVHISEINFVPVKPRNGLLGFVSFVFNRQFYFGNIVVFSRVPEPGRPTYRLSYPEDRLRKKSIFHPIDREVQQTIESQVSAYLDKLFQDDQSLYHKEEGHE